ncbi:hypothetical protein AMTRI_Chr04g250410 [Amborella trichopoda]
MFSLSELSPPPILCLLFSLLLLLFFSSSTFFFFLRTCVKSRKNGGTAQYPPICSLLMNSLLHHFSAFVLSTPPLIPHTCSFTPYYQFSLSPIPHSTIFFLSLPCCVLK